MDKLSPYRKAIVAAVVAVGVVVGNIFEIEGLPEAVAAVGAAAVYWVPNAPYGGE